MKLLLDSCVWGGAKHAFAAAGHDAIRSGDCQQDPGDAEILATAYREGRVLVTIDKDFGDLPVHRGLPHCGIVRIVDFPARQQAQVCELVLEQFAADIAARAIVTVERGRVRIRRPE